MKHLQPQGSMTTQTPTGATAFVAALREAGVTHLFGYPGAVALPLFDALYDADDIEVVVPRHEQGAVHMADGYARATGSVGVALVTSGPGATNAVTGIANAYMDSIPLIVFTAQVATTALGTDAFQESDITGITLPVTKHSYLVKTADELLTAVREAFHIAGTGRPGPIVIDIPVDVAAQPVSSEAAHAALAIPGYKPTTRGNARQIAQAVRALKAAVRPVVYAGGGVIAAGASEQLKELAELLELPVATTLMGRGCFPEDHHLWIGMPGMHGAKYTNFALQESDLLLTVGARFDDRVTGDTATFAPAARIIHIDIDPAEIGKLKHVDIPIVGDARDVLAKLVEALEKEHPTPQTGAWFEQIDTWRRTYPLHYNRQRAATALLPEPLIEQVVAAAPHADGAAATIFATEVGQNQMWAAQYAHPTAPRCWLSSGGLGTMGFGLPAAIGAALGRPKAMVVCFSGDGSFQMTMQELAVAAHYRLPIKVFILNNASLGMITQWQRLFYEGRYAASRLAQGCPDFALIAQAYGIKGLTLSEPAQIEQVVADAFATEGPVVVDCRIASDEMVFPMVAPGTATAPTHGGVSGGSIDRVLEAHDCIEEER